MRVFPFSLSLGKRGLGRLYGDKFNPFSLWKNEATDPATYDVKFSPFSLWIKNEADPPLQMTLSSLFRFALWKNEAMAGWR